MVPVPLDGGRVFLDHKDDRAVMLEIGDGGGRPAMKSLWEERCTAKSYVAPVRLGDFIYGYNGRTPTCIAAKTGKPAWRSRQPGDGFPIIVDGHLVILTKDGSLHVSRATPDRYGLEDSAPPCPDGSSRPLTSAGPKNPANPTPKRAAFRGNAVYPTNRASVLNPGSRTLDPGKGVPLG
jgi:outer membrane protein assembly factor BamB